MTLQEEIKSVKELGNKIGYGNLMMFASALWRKSLKDKGYPIKGAFVPRIDKLNGEDKVYDNIVK